MEGHAVVPAVHPVHVGEEGDAAGKEGEQHHAAVGFVQPAVLKAELTARRDGGRREKQGVTMGPVQCWSASGVTGWRARALEGPPRPQLSCLCVT